MKAFIGLSPWSRIITGAILLLPGSVVTYAQSTLRADGLSPTEVQSARQSTPEANDLQKRIERARALAAAHQLEVAASELESVRNSTREGSVRNVTSVMLMGIYIEEGNYPRAESLMEETFRERSPNNEASVRSYFALAGRAVNGTRSHLQRYRDFGINVSDPTLPGEALTDLSRLRALLERMIAQAKEITSETRAYDSLALLEDVLGIRMSLAVDSEDRTKWETEYANAREVLASSETQVAALRGIPFLSPSTKPANPAVPVKENNRVGDDSGKSPASESKSAVPTAETGREKRAVSQTTSTSASSSQTEKPAESSTVSADGGNADVPRVISTGLLNARATKRVIPTYPSVAKSAGAQGVVRVYVTIDESGKVIEVSRSEGPIMLRETAEQAARAWKFAPTAVGGKAVKLSGYIEFNFTL